MAGSISIGVRKGAWTEEEDKLLRKCIEIYGEGKWHLVPSRAGLNRCRKSCRLRWLNYLKPNIKRGEFAEDEVDLMVRLHKLLGNRWSLIAARLPGRTSNDVKNYWNTHIQKRVSNKKMVRHEKTEMVKPIVIRPRPRIFSKSSPWLKEKVSAAAENSSQLKDNVNSPSLASELHVLEWWESLLDDKEIHGGSTCSARELEDQSNKNFWLQEIAPAMEIADTTVEKEKNDWIDIPFETDDFWNVLSAI